MQDDSIIVGELKQMLSRTYHIASGDTIYIVKIKEVKKIDKLSDPELKIILDPGRYKHYEISDYQTVKYIPTRSRSNSVWIMFACTEIFGQVKQEFSNDYLSYKDKKDAAVGFSFGLCRQYSLNNKFTAGIGLNWQLVRKLEDFEDPEDQHNTGFYYIPIYTSGTYELFTHGKVNLRCKLKLGYNFYHFEDQDLFSENNGGLFWSAGADIILLNRFIVDVMYQINRHAYQKVDYEYNSLKISLGIILGY